jgi:rhodanese-related sulfurtransferase
VHPREGETVLVEPGVFLCMEVDTRMKDDSTTHQIKPQELHDGSKGSLQPLVIDVRSADEYASGHVQGAVYIPLEELPDRLAKLSHDQLVVTYYNMSYPGESQGERATALLREQDYQAQVLTGGYPNWKNLLFPIEETQKVKQAKREGSNTDTD